MPSKRTTAKSDTKHGLTKAAACAVLQVASTADDEIVTQAYWHLARKYRAYATQDPEARQRLDELNRAYLVLNPGQAEAPLADEIPDTGAKLPLADAFSAWLRGIIEQTRARWPEHVSEVTTLTATTALLAFLALSAGASPLWTLLVAGVAAVTIWAPWRRT